MVGLSEWPDVGMVGPWWRDGMADWLDVGMSEGIYKARNGTL